MQGGDHQFEHEVFPAELDEVRKRRKVLGLDTDKLGGAPSVDQELAGLALSGGGIRSATFSLGVVQGLAEHGILKHVDFLSTVSGGGYIGSCISSLLNDPKNRPERNDFPLKYSAGSEEPPALTHLRNSSNYLSPGGLLSTLRLPTLLLRGILLNLFVFLPFIMAAVFVTEVAYEKGPHWDHLPKLIMPLVFLFLLLAIAFPFAVRLLRSVFDWPTRNAYELLLTVPLLLALLLLAMIPILNITQLAIEHSTLQLYDWVRGLEPKEWWHASLILAPVVLLFMLAGKASENVAKLRGKLLLFLVGMIGPIVIFSIYLFLCLWQIDSPFIPAGAADVLNQAAACDQPCLMREAKRGLDQPPPDTARHAIQALVHAEEAPQNLSGLIDALRGRHIVLSNDAVVYCQSIKDNPCRTEPTGSWDTDERVWVIDLRKGDSERLADCPQLEDLESNAESWVKNCVYFTRATEHTLRVEGADLDLFSGTRDYTFLAIFVLLLLFNRFFLDINSTSPHGFYRDRLSKAFLFRVNESHETEQNDVLKLTDLNAEYSAAPYHIINVALNLQAGKEPDLRGRMSDFFIFSKNFTGSDRTGYARTEIVEKYDRHLDLATATAISGAAAAPNMGTTTNRSLIFIMTLLNIRLGYWLPNPRNVNRQYWYKRLDLGGAKPTLLWKESLGLIDARGSHVNVSDGGHIENLAIYPLLKRRCKFIVAVDGEADPDMRFGGLVTLMRFARIDMGIEIEMDLEGIRKDADGFSESHWTLGTIRYGSGKIGHLLYIKLSVSGDEPEYIRAYRAQHAEYPHEPTSDQFFAEDQFEAYRALGEHICEGMLGDVDKLGGFRSLGEAAKI